MTGFAQLPSGTWQYAWGDDFSGNAVDGSRWNVASPSWTMPNSLSTAAANQVSVAGGILTLDATRTATSGTVQFSSGSVSTYQKQNFNGGYIEARIWLPDTPGSWPAFWGLYTGWPPECDIMEYPIDTAAGSGYAQDQYHTAFHYTNTSGATTAGAGLVNPASAGDLGGAWHTFGVNWVEDSSVTFYFDGAQVSSFTNGVEVAEMVSMYLILDYAVGGWPGTPNTTEWPLGFTDQTKVDWVRVWKSAAAKTSNWAYTGTTGYQSWDTAANWSNGAPNLGGVTSGFSTVAGVTEHQLDWSGTRSLSVINLDGSTRYRFGWPDDRLALVYGNGGALAPAINIASTSTASHEIYGELEWSGDLAIANNSSQPLLLTGRVLGGSAINIDGAGTVSFDGGSNSYSGNTVIDSGSAGPGVARARGRNALGVGGTVTIGSSGNATTGRLELENGALVSNPVNFCGRNNSSAAILNNSGTNTLSGTLSIQPGGGTYLIQSDSGLLNLSGSPAISSVATGTRNVTLQGAGDGAALGAIQNGSATVNLVKSGTGTWTLGAQNSHTGTTTISQGTLVVDGSTGTGTTTVGSGATLAGHGTVKNNLTASSGSTVRIGGNGLPSAFESIDNFASYPAGDIGAVPNSTGNIWTGVFNGTANADIIDNSGNKALAVNGTNSGTSPWRGAITDLKNARTNDFSLPDGQSGTYFLRVRSANTSTTDFIFGLSDQAASTGTAPGNDTTDPWNEYAVTLSISGGNLRGFSTGSGDVNIAPITSNQWLNVWIAVDNNAKTFRVATSTGTADGTLSPTVFNFGRRTAAGSPLLTLGLHERVNVVGQIDDLQFASGTKLTNPLAAIPAKTGETLTVQNTCTLAAGSTAAFDIAGPGIHDKLIVGGAFNASGTLKVTLDPTAAAPAPGHTYDLFDSAGGSIDFTAYDLPSLTTGLMWDTSSIATGAISVAADPTVYQGWALTRSFAPGTSGPTADPDHDGIANAFEWLLNGNPGVSDTILLPVGAPRSVTTGLFPGADSSKRYLALTATIRKNISGMALTAQAAASPALLDAPGSSSNIFTRQLSDLGDFEQREWICTIPLDAAASRFMRLKLSGN